MNAHACGPRRLALALTMSLFALPAAATELVGKVVGPYPDGLASQIGSCVPHAGEICAFGVEVLADAKGVRRWLVAAQAVDGGARPTWRILDALPYPTLAAGEEFFLGECERDGVEDAGVAAIATATPDVEWFQDVRQAWRLDPVARRLVAIDPAQVRCPNLAAGL